MAFTLEAPGLWRPSERTGIDFVDPGGTGAFDVDVKIQALLGRFKDLEDAIRKVQGDPIHRQLLGARGKLASLAAASRLAHTFFQDRRRITAIRQELRRAH